MYADTPELLMLTMVCALIGSTTWVLFASSKGFPVSTTHAIHFVLKHYDSFRRGVIAIPAYFGVALTVQVFYIIFKGAPKSDLRKASIGIPIGIAVVPYLRRKIQDDEDLKWCHVFYIPMVSERVKPALDQEETAEKDGSRIPVADGQVDPSLHATKFEPQIERLFSAVQAVTACFTSFAHSSNDVANAIGPLATIYHVWVHSSVDLKKTAVPIWILVLGGVAIDIGLMTYGYHMATSITILTYSKLKLPVSFTQCVTGATASIDLLSGSGFRSLNYKALLIVLVAASSLS
ncbi:MAG: phosphate transporter family-domain-containing protein [Podila humilis]|nr:MAG: phosphate transporter family-domain-containing protein [Podila humilis]